MIETDAHREAALSWIAYWKTAHATGGQSWMADEQSLEAIMRLRQSIDDYETRRIGDGTSDDGAAPGR